MAVIGHHTLSHHMIGQWLRGMAVIGPRAHSCCVIGRHFVGLSE